MKTWLRLTGLTANILLFVGNLYFADAPSAKLAGAATAVFVGGC
jgi:hypothetical protein